MAEKSGSRILGWVTLALAALTCGTIAYAVMQGPRTVTHKEIYDRNAMLDPDLGDTFDLTSLGGEPIIVAALGDCGGCALKKTDMSPLRQSGGYKVVGLYTEGADLRHMGEKYSWLSLVQDSNTLHDSLNAYFTPRAYGFDANGKLLAMQKLNESLDVFLVRLGRAL